MFTFPYCTPFTTSCITFDLLKRLGGGCVLCFYNLSLFSIKLLHYVLCIWQQRCEKLVNAWMNFTIMQTVCLFSLPFCAHAEAQTSSELRPSSLLLGYIRIVYLHWSAGWNPLRPADSQASDWLNSGPDAFPRAFYIQIPRCIENVFIVVPCSNDQLVLGGYSRDDSSGKVFLWPGWKTAFLSINNQYARTILCIWVLIFFFF